MSDQTAMHVIERQFSENRKHALAHRICHVLQDTLLVRGQTPETNTDDIRVDFTDKSLLALAPLIEAIDILEAIIFASDGCVGHRDCAHSMEPWQRARALLNQKWEADVNPYAQWPGISKVQCLDCGWQGLDSELKAQACPVCDGRCADV